jgi:hypothetical protein
MARLDLGSVAGNLRVQRAEAPATSAVRTEATGSKRRRVNPLGGLGYRQLSHESWGRPVLQCHREIQWMETHRAVMAPRGHGPPRAPGTRRKGTLCTRAALVLLAPVNA